MSCGHPHTIPLPSVGDDSQTSRLADELAMSIHLGQVAPGSPLREVEIADSHGVSRTIVRAALQRLEAQGLAEIVLNKGARVRMVSPSSVADMIELHADLTALAARYAAERASPAHIDRIEQFVDMLEHVAEDVGSPQEFQHLRIGFARTLFEAAGPVLAERLRCAAPVVPHHGRAMEDVRDAAGQAEAAKLARVVLNAIEARSPDAAAKAAERLLRRHAERTTEKPQKPAVQRPTAPRKARSAA
jgi:DNA-binding GntR family transcriptional regulator